MWLINQIREKMIRKWVALNIGVTGLVIGIIGFSVKELACRKFNEYASSSLHAQQFRKSIGEDLFNAGLLTLILAVLIHLFFAKKILNPLNQLSHTTKELDETIDSPFPTHLKDEIGQIANRLNEITNQVSHLHKQKNQMMVDLGHELRTPLTTLTGYLEGLEEGVFVPNEQVYSILKKECFQLTHLVNKIQELHQWESGRKSLERYWIESGRALQSSIEPFQNEMNKRDIERVIQVESATLYCDSNALHTVVSHIFDNVVRYNIGKKVIVKGKSYRDNYVISISNQGMPIPKEAEKQLFDHFFRVENSRNRETGGFGLGLSIAKEIVHQLGGEIGFYSRSGFHTFWFTIPIEKEGH
ncbi:sensor histidine kinase [Priestia filamentosa]|uniref:sensor histidine kinase n=1 Tax=Priestia filamentosa TaxID=1402861 RepID=UPI0023495E4C|nr:HAMP domain-containing sensor histidine kinase [Priestia filamentosa]WCM16190.1 HAMP domain-containing sensor histidine kinase [Priestia filamentosa]